MTADVVAVSGTLIGVALGGFINFVANRSAKQREWRLGIDKELLFLRNRAYAEFLDEYLAQLAVMPRTDFPALEERLRLKSKLHAMAFLGSTKPVVVAENMIKRLHASQPEQGPGLLDLHQDFLNAATADLSLLTRDLPRR